MKGLLYKNFMSFRIHLLALGLMLFFSGLMCITFAYVDFSNMKSGITEPDTSLFTVCMVMMFFITFFLIEPLSGELFATDEKATTCCFFFSTPQSGKGLIQSKYYFILLIDLGVLFGCFLIDTIVMVIMGEYAVSTLIQSPFHVRFGAKMGPEVQGLFVYTFFCLIVVYALFGNISFFFEENILEAFMAYLQSGKVIFVLSLLPYVAVLLYYLSYRISLLLYRKGVETYEQ